MIEKVKIKDVWKWIIIITLAIASIFTNFSYHLYKYKMKGVEDKLQLLEWINNFNTDAPLVSKDFKAQFDRSYYKNDSVFFRITLTDKVKDEIDWQSFSELVHSNIKGVVQNWSIYTYYNVSYVFDIYDMNDESIGQITFDSGAK